MANLGISEKELYGSPVSPSSSEDGAKRIIYPTFSLNEKQVDKAGCGECSQDDFYIATVLLRVSSKSSDETDRGEKRRLEFEVQDIKNLKATGEKPEAGKEDEGETYKVDSQRTINMPKRGKSKSPKESGIEGFE